MTGARDRQPVCGGVPQHLLSVSLSVSGGCQLKLAGVLLHLLELVSDGLDCGCLLVGWLNHDRGLQTRRPGSGLVWHLGWIWLAVGCIWRGGLVGCPSASAPAAAATSAPLGGGGGGGDRPAGSAG